MKKTILITGCSSGIGYCVAHGLKERGYRVFATARQDSDVERLHSEGLESLQLDLTDSTSIQQAVDTLLTQTDGELYGLFNNGGYTMPGAVEDITREALRAQFETNLFGWSELTNLVIPVMRKQNEGRIIQNSSVLGMVPFMFRGAYVASKFALEGMSSCLRLELHGTNIHVSLIEPGPIVSKIRDNSLIAFKRYVDIDNSVHRDAYRNVLARLETEGPVMKSTLPPTAVLKRVIHALESRRPKIRYYVTTPTYYAGILRRILPYRTLDWLLTRGSGGGKH